MLTLRLEKIATELGGSRGGSTHERVSEGRQPVAAQRVQETGCS